ncbi:uncharacterized protein LOC126737797 [Anthonomus grandis grandis]|uniref:uncharacterized protein LOC126737797 n=1 Tax=Anthonomus grandis grandis TaxID=2921223 RepID=UPI002165C922|nr:uncharacterized protein LOC126737797 [Anthonomus grandis grandis]
MSNSSDEDIPLSAIIKKRSEKLKFKLLEELQPDKSKEKPAEENINKKLPRGQGKSSTCDKIIDTECVMSHSFYDDTSLGVIQKSSEKQRKSEEDLVLGQVNRNSVVETINELSSRDEKQLNADDNEDFGEDCYDSDADPPYKATCEVRRCKVEVFSSCERCLILLCWDHFIDNPDCSRHDKSYRENKAKRISNSNTNLQPEHHTVEGTEKEEVQNKKNRVNKQKLAKHLRNSGKEYLTVKGLKVISARVIKPRCGGESCQKLGRRCSTIDESQRLQIFAAYYELADVNRQREFIVRHTEKIDTKQKTTKTEQSRRQNSVRYFFL